MAADSTSSVTYYGAADSSEFDSVEGAAEAVTVSLDDPTFRGSMGKGKRFQLALSERFSNLRRRKAAGVVSGTKRGTPTGGWSYQDLLAEEKIDQSQTSSSSLNQESNEKTEEFVNESLDPNSQFHTLLYTQGGTYNEHVIHAAKDLGRGLFSELEVRERKTKINEQVDVLQKEIDAVTQQRLDVLQEMKTNSDAQRRKDLSVDMTRIDDKLQALAVLMLHYCAGLQHCLDLEEMSSAAADQVGNTGETEDSVVGCEKELTLEAREEGENDCPPQFSLTEASAVQEQEQAATDQHNKELLDYLVSSHSQNF